MRMLLWKTIIVIAILVEVTSGLGYVSNGEYFEIPKGAKIVMANPAVDSSLDQTYQIKRASTDRAWRHIGLGKRAQVEPNLSRDLRDPSPAWRHIGLGKRSSMNSQRYDEMISNIR